MGDELIKKRASLPNRPCGEGRPRWKGVASYLLWTPPPEEPWEPEDEPRDADPELREELPRDELPLDRPDEDFTRAPLDRPVETLERPVEGRKPELPEEGRV
jgi:hypothetical protein